MKRIQRGLVTCSETLLLPIAFVIFFLWNRHEKKMLGRATLTPTPLPKGEGKTK